MLAPVYDLLGTFVWKKSISSSLHGGKLYFASSSDMTTVVDNCSHVVTRQSNGKLFCNALAVALENVALSQQ